MAVLSAQNLNMSFGDRTLFDGVSFEINAGERVGLIGANGTGKTTLFRLVLGTEKPTSGEIHPGRNTVVGYMEQHACRDSRKTIYDEIMTVFDPLIAIEKRLEQLNSMIDNGGDIIDTLIDEQLRLTEQFERDGGLTCRSRARSTLIGLGFAADTHTLTCDKLSGGQRSKLSLGKLLLSEPDLLLLDEPTNHLDIDSVEWLESFLADYRGAALIISHDRYFLDRVTTRTMEIEHRKMRIYKGGYSEFIKQKEKDKEIAQRHYDNTMDEVHRIEKMIEQQRRWNRERNIRTAEHKQKSIDRLMDGLEKPEADEATLRFEFKTLVETGNDVLICQGLTKGFGGEPLFQNADLLLKKGERAFLLGANGCGKTTFLRVIMGEYIPQAGLRKFGENVRAGYFDQTLSGLSDDKTVLDEVWDQYRRLSQTEVRNALAAFLFRGDAVFSRVGDLSGGEKARVALLKLMLGGYNLLLLDEPTNHLDITSREALEDALMGYDGTMLIVSHDRYFINKLSTRILRLGKEKIEEFGNDYDEYLSRLEALRQGVKAVKEKTAPKVDNYKLRKERESEKRKLNTAFRRCEENIENTEKLINETQAELENPETSADYEKIMALTTKLEELNTSLEQLYEDWENIQLRLAEFE
ncbi:MAG: ABC-F family ATP-binding cassette domain-containing protein [Clostridia bacterium]|nr:ABC-F family ATP-binding cassette domain-containing protein [Clostridia bacterium]